MSANPTFDQVFAQEVSTQQRQAADVRLLPPVSAAPTVGFGRLLATEVRKLVNTITGRVMLAIIGALTIVGAVLLVVIFEDLAELGWSEAVGVVGFGITLLLPVLGILLATQEWTQRTALTTFTIEPRRGRVLVAKMLVVLGFAVAAFVLVSLVTMGTYAIAAAVNDVGMTWAPDWSVLGGGLGVLVLNTLMAMGFGMLLMNTPAAIVVYMGLPTVMPLVSMINADVAKAMTWVDPNQAWAPLMGAEWTSDSTARFAVSVGIWIVIPLVLGVLRQLRREVK